MPADSTAKAAEQAASDHDSACISSKVCADLFELDILADQIANSSNNTTRFLIMGKDRPIATTMDQTLIKFTINACLDDVLQVFKSHNIGILRIDTRPSKVKLW